MSIQTAKKDTLLSAEPIYSTNYTVLRWKQDIWKESSRGILGVSKIEPHRTNIVGGADFLYSTSRFLGDKNLSVTATYARSYTSDSPKKSGSAQRLSLDFPNDLVDFSAKWDRAGTDFNPEVGYLRRRDYQMYNADLRMRPRPTFLPWIRRLEFKPFDFNYYIYDSSGKLQSLWSEFRPLGFSTKSGEKFEFNIQRSAENLLEDFEIYENIVIPRGEYWFTHYELQFETFEGRPAFGSIFVNWGDFYNGRRTELSGEVGWRLNKHLSLSMDYPHNDISLPAGRFTVNETGGALN